MVQLGKCYKHEGPSLIPSHHIKRRVWWHTPVAPQLKRQRWAHPWGLLPTQCGLIGRSQVPDLPEDTADMRCQAYGP